MTSIIVEVCQNHLGSRSMLGEMIAAAAEAGADYVKMQTIFSEDLTHRERFDEGTTGPDGNILTMKRPYAAEKERLSSLDLTEEDHLFFIEQCKKFNVTPFTTVFARGRIPFVASLPWPQKVVKVASYDCASAPLLSELCDRFDHLIISTGATYDEEIAAAAAIVRGRKKKLTLLHCVTSYPNTPGMCNLKRMAWLRSFTDSVGWSDHTLVERDGIDAAKAAIALGADFVERHFTILEKDQTKDGPVSITPALLRDLKSFTKLPEAEQMENAKAMKNFETMLGMEQRDMTDVELLNRDYYRGRFATHAGNEWIYNWEEKPVPSLHHA